MSVTQDRAALERQSFDMVRPMVGRAAGLFYHRLFERAPEVALLFAGTGMTRPGHKLVATLNLIAHSLDEPEIAGPIAAELGERHVRYGTRPEHFPAVGDALVWAMGQALGPATSPRATGARTSCSATRRAASTSGRCWKRTDWSRP